MTRTTVSRFLLSRIRSFRIEPLCKSMIPLTPHLHPLVKDLLKQEDFLHSLASSHAGPVHVLVPEIMDENIQAFRKVFAEFAVQPAIHFAHKCNQSSVFLKRAKHGGINVDVASLQELQAALSVGFLGKAISCTGPKNDAFLRLAIKSRCLISVDSLEELHRVAEIAKQGSVEGVDVLLRINDLAPAQRKLVLKPSRFGISQHVLPQAYALLREHPTLQLRGFHHHHDGYDAIAKAEFIDNMLKLTRQAYDEGFRPDVLDLGGSFRAPVLRQPSDWTSFVDRLCEQVRNGEEVPVWGTQPYGLHLDTSGQIIGREKVLSLAVSEHYGDFLRSLLSSKLASGRSVAQTIGDSLFTFMIEPGFALVYNAGFSLLKVIEVKSSSGGQPLIVLDGNLFSLSTKMVDVIADPILISRGTTEKRPLTAYLVGNLCREDDFLMKRAVTFDRVPQPGDVLVFANTAAYASDFEETSSILQPKGKKVVCVKKQNGWHSLDEQEYLL